MDAVARRGSRRWGAGFALSLIAQAPSPSGYRPLPPTDKGLAGVAPGTFSHSPAYLPQNSATSKRPGWDQLSGPEFGFPAMNGLNFRRVSDPEQAQLLPLPLLLLFTTAQQTAGT